MFIQGGTFIPDSRVHAFIFHCYSDQNSDKTSVHIIQECKWFFAFSEQQKIQINFQRPLVLSLGIKPRTAR